MSRKAAPTAGCKLEKIPHIFERYPSTSPVRLVNSQTLELCGSRVIRADGIPSTRKNRRRYGKTHDTKRFVEKQIIFNATDDECCTTNANSQDLECEVEDKETVANIEKWLKTRSKSISSVELDAIKSEVEEVGAQDKYLDDDMPRTFLGKDPDVLSMDMDLSDKKLTLGYDPLLQDLQSEKLLEVCEKDEFTLPSFQLDHLDSLAMTPDDMMVAGEILPSTSDQSTLSVAPGSLDPTDHDSEQSFSTSEHFSEDEDLIGKSGCANPEASYTDENAEARIEESRAQVDTIFDATKRIVNVYVEAVGHVDVETNVVDALPVVDRHEERKPKTKVKLEPRIIKKRRISSLKDEKNAIRSRNIARQAQPIEGIMAVVAISTDKISNMTQIVINTGREEQIYQGKTSELIEATGNFPQLSRIQSSCHETQPVTIAATSELTEDRSPSSEHDLVISNALEELGITDDTLLPVSTSEHGKIWVCPREDCRRQFNRLYALKGHILSHYGVRPFKCDFKGCTWAFYSEFKLKRHKETHLKRKDYVCEEENCGRRFTTIYNLLTHKKLHSRPSKVFCHVPDCQERFQTRRALELHMRSHDQSHAPYTCKQEGCGKRYYSSNALTSHQRCHNYKEVDVKCSWPGCSKLFDKPCRLKAHIRSHTGYKPYLCTFQGCTWAFSSSSKLKRHQKKHTNERKFVCDVTACGKAFMRSEHLKEHRLTHKNGTYFQCRTCDAKFSAKSSLYVHIKKHQSVDSVVTVIETPAMTESQQEDSIEHQSLQQLNSVDEEDCGVVSYEADSTGMVVGPNDEHDATAWPTDEIANSQEDQSFHLDRDLTFHMSTSDLSASNSVGDNCNKLYAADSTLEGHLLRIHGIPVAGDDRQEFVNGISPTRIEQIQRKSPRNSVEHTIAGGSGQILMDNSTMEVHGDDTAEPESPPSFDSVLKISEASFQQAIQHQTSDECITKEPSCARTDLTYNDFLRCKANSDIFNSTVGATDVVLGAAGLVEGLLLPEDLPSVYYQDDITSGECQVLLLDSGPPESTINLRDLE